ncbi:hypothetical protein [Flavobacterium polysaccharolyticum]|uniref:Tripartite tricarboxylate transporter TctB family protein n=1 Tax=Flavobacterium polysaccharolyticum TaxID=3133148 RepID=A0ABU9NNM7_9FLAO
MNSKQNLKIRLYFTATITIAIFSLLLWNYFHGGVPSHHILQRKDLPEISNGWGAILLPMLTWFLLKRMQKRIVIHEDGSISNGTKNTVYAFLAALIYGMLLAVFFTFGIRDLPFYMLIGLLVIALFYPIFRSECLLGFVIGMTYTFGAILPTGIGLLFMTLGAIIHLGIRPAILFVVKKSVQLFSSVNEKAS